MREANTAGGPTAVINSSISVPGFVRRRTAPVGQDPHRLVVVKKQGSDWARVGDRGDEELAVKQGCDWGACGRPWRRDLATSLALGDGRGEGGPARWQGRRG